MPTTTLTPALAAYATGQAIEPLWVSPSGRKFYPIAGGADDNPPNPDDAPKVEPPKPDDPPKFEPVTSQEEFDRRLSARLVREREKYADYEDLKKKAEAYDKDKEAAQTEQEKAVEAAKAEGATAERQRTNQLLVRAKAETLAAQAQFVAPDAVVASLDLRGIKVDEDGKVDVDALKVQIDAAAASGAFVIGDGKTRPAPDRSQGGGGGSIDAPSVSRGADLFAEKRGKKTTTAS